MLFHAQCYALDLKDIELLGSLGWDDSKGDQIALPSTDSTSASRGWAVKVGLEIPNNESKTFVTQFLLGYKTSHSFLDETGEALADIFPKLFHVGNHRYSRFTRYPIEVVEQYQFSDKYRLGVGVTYHLNPKLECVETQEGACASIPSMRFNDARGALIQFSRQWEAAEVGVRYTSIDYKKNDQRFDGGSWGLFVVLHLPLGNFLSNLGNNGQ
jgi:hypothetical protein